MLVPLNRLRFRTVRFRRIAGQVRSVIILNQPVPIKILSYIELGQYNEGTSSLLLTLHIKFESWKAVFFHKQNSKI